MRRRAFIRGAGLLAAGMLLPIKKIFCGPTPAEEAILTWTELIDYARWCPSPHHVQPWRMKIISTAEAHLYYDPKRLPSVVDGSSAFSTVGLGMFIECLDIAARKNHIQIVASHANEPVLNGHAPDLQLFAKLYRVQTPAEISVDRELIKKRKTSRLSYDGKIISEDIIRRLTALAEKYGQQFSFSTDEDLIRYTIDLNSKTVLQRADEEDTRKEMGQWIRTTDEEAKEKKDGLWYKCNNISANMFRNFFFHHERFKSKWKRNFANHKMNKTMDGTANLAWITGPFSNRADWVNTGAMLQQLWLEMTKHDVYMHPLGTIVTTPSSSEAFRRRIGFNGPANDFWFLVRMGYSKEPPRSFRLETKDILMS